MTDLLMLLPQGVEVRLSKISIADFSGRETKWSFREEEHVPELTGS
jgi:hypothetical protein